MMRRDIALALVLGTVAWATPGCDVFEPGLLDGAIADGETGDAPDGGGCVLRKPPPRPDVADSEDAGHVLLVMKDVVLDQGMGRWRDIGFDLDGICSRSPAPELSCMPPEGISGEVDGNGGIDNTVGHNLLQLVDVALEGTLQDISRDAQEKGNGAFLFRVYGWNGEPDDPEVRAVFAQSRIGAPPTEDDSPPEMINNDKGEVFLADGSIPPKPEWSHQDYFWGRSDNFVGGNPDLPRIEDTEAYVANGILVTRFASRVDLAFGGDMQGVLVKTHGTVFTAPLLDQRPDHPSYGAAMVGTRWSVDALVESARGVGVCEGTTEYDVLQATLDEAVDITSDPDAPNDTPCDAVSVGVSLQTYRGRWAGILEPERVANLCDDTPTDGGMPDGAMPDAGVVDGGVQDGGASDGG